MFITFEGTEGAGKSTLIRNLAIRMKSKNSPRRFHKVLLTREPGGTPLGEKIRSLLLHQEMDPWTEALLYQAARAEHVAQVILPALKKGVVVLCDRYTDSTLAYQGVARGLDLAKLKVLNKIATRGLTPKVSVFLDLPPKLGLKRVKNPNKFEAEGLKFQMKVRSGFLKVIKENPKRWIKVNVFGKSPDQVCEEVYLAILKRKTR